MTSTHRDPRQWHYIEWGGGVLTTPHELVTTLRQCRTPALSSTLVTCCSPLLCLEGASLCWAGAYDRPDIIWRLEGLPDEKWRVCVDRKKRLFDTKWSLETHFSSDWMSYRQAADHVRREQAKGLVDHSLQFWLEPQSRYWVEGKVVLGDMTVDGVRWRGDGI